jgi:hypothetical protein
MTRFIKMLFPLFLFAIMFSQSIKAQINAKGGEKITLSGFSFNHPMTVTSVREIEEVKKRLKNGVEPQTTAFKLLIIDANRAQHFVPDPPDSMLIMGGYEPNSNLRRMRPWLWRNCSAAYASALAFAYTGEERYAKKAVEILNVWARKETVFTGQDRGLQLGSYFSPMLYAADLLHGYKGWTETQREDFKKWWINNCLVHTYDVMVHRDNNWKDAGLLGVMCASVVFEDKALLEESLNELSSYFGIRNDDNVREKGSQWKIRKDEKGVYLPREVVRNEGRSGLTYTGYTLTTLVQCMEIARYSGYSFWDSSTPEGGTIQAVIEQFYRWMIAGDTFPWNPKPDRTNEWFRYNVFEIANNNCDLPPEIVGWIASNRPLMGAQGDEYVTLNKGYIIR